MNNRDGFEPDIVGFIIALLDGDAIRRRDAVYLRRSVRPRGTFFRSLETSIPSSYLSYIETNCKSMEYNNRVS